MGPHMGPLCVKFLYGAIWDPCSINYMNKYHIDVNNCEQNHYIKVPYGPNMGLKVIYGSYMGDLSRFCPYGTHSALLAGE